MSGSLPTVRQWLRDKSDDAMPKCPECGRYLGIRDGMFSECGRDVWLCDYCDEEFDPKSATASEGGPG
jgi:ribosomal protein L37AE/L43A